jgi:GNAT superfamily N-acetyltransferase
MIRVRPRTAADVPLGLRLCRAAGWNQVEADWRRFLALQPDGCFVAELDGDAVGTATACVLGGVGWIAMMLVAESARRRGVGTALMNAALAFLDDRVPTVRLDATPLGRPLYERLGFVEQFELARYEGAPQPISEIVEVVKAPPDQWEALAALDETATQADRRRLLFRLFAEQPDAVRMVRRGDRIVGFASVRLGERAIQLGPCIADAEAGPLLLADALRRCAGRRVYLDVPVGHAAARIAEAHGLTVQRRLTRMVRGVAVCERLDWFWASSGPEKG